MLSEAAGELGDKRAKGREDRAVVVVLRRNLDLAGEKVHHGLVAAVVAVGKLLNAGARSQGDHLVAQADAKDGELAENGAHGLGHGGHGVGVAGAVGEEDAVGLHGNDFLGRRVPGDNRDLDAHLGHAPHDAGLLAAVHGNHAVVHLALGPHDVRLLAGDVGDVVVLLDVRGFADAADEALGVEVRGRDCRAHGPALANGQGDRTGVYALDAHYTAGRKEVRQAHDALPVAWRVAGVMAHKALEMQCVCLHVLLVDAVVTQLGIGEGDNLTRI